MVFNHQLPLASYLVLILFLNNSSAKPFAVIRGPSVSRKLFFNKESDFKNLTSSKFEPQVPKCAETGLTFCSIVKNYPTEFIFQLIQNTVSNNFNFSSLFDDERSSIVESKPKKTEDFSLATTRTGIRAYKNFSLASFTNPPIVQKKLNINRKPICFTRINTNTKPTFVPHLNQTLINKKVKRVRSKRQEFHRTENLCEVRTTYVAPRAALNDKSEWKFIINLGKRDPKLRQVIKVNTCLRPNSPCSNQISLPLGYTSRCKQKYIKKKLLSLDINGLGTSVESFFVPSCCVCEIIRSFAK